MDNTFYPKQIKKWILTIHRSFWISLITFVSTSLPNFDLSAQCLTASKELLGINAASSGITGNIDASYRIRIINTNGGLCPIAINIQISEQLNSVSNLGSSFVRIVGLPNMTITGVSIAPTYNISFNGTTNANMTNNDGLLFAGDIITVNFVVELNPRATGTPSSLNNSAIVSSLIPVSSVSTNVVTIPNCWRNCQMACNNTIHLSVNSLCEASLLAEMVLEGNYSQECLDLGFYTVQLSYNGIPVSMPLNKSYVGKKLVATVTNIVCGNSCWGNVLVEDKTAPALICRVRDTFRCNVDLRPSVFGFPVNPAFVNQTVYPYIVTGIDACGAATLTFRDSVASYSCADTLASTIYRRWCATDPSGYTSCCIDTIDIARGTLADLTPPPHFDGQPGNQPALKCNGNWTKFPNGMPDTTSTGTGRPQGLLCGNIQFDFSDDTIRVCDGSFKLLRRWLIIDWCRPNNRVTYIQQIKVVDDIAPIVICPTTITINTDPHVCTGSFTLPEPQTLVPGVPADPKIPYVIESCSRWTYTVLHRPATSSTDCTPDPGVFGTTNNVVKLANGQYKVVNMPFGCNWIYYRICDDCGNCTECTFDIEVKDLTPPVPVCQQRTVVSLTGNGFAIVPAEVFDDKSFDNCELGTYEIRRMNFGPCGTTTYASTQTFCCADVAASPIRVVLKVTDKAGNTGECMVDVVVQDKLPPKVTCPRDTVVYCATDLSNLSVFGNASSTDNCSVSTSSRVENNLTACNIGNLKRWFIVTDPGGRKDSCFHTITVRDTAPFRESDITWPADLEITGCKNATSPDITGRPIFRNQDKCNQIVHNYDDLVFNYVEGVCYKILRKWTVIDWCNFDVQNPTRGAWYHTQVIKIINNAAPTINSSCDNRELCITDNCSVRAVLSASATDDCTDVAELIWKYEFDTNNDGTINVVGSSKSYAPTLGPGTHKITWTVGDQCGNSTKCSYLINVKDCKAPTPYCNTGIITVIMPSTKEVSIWAKDFNLGSFDNCTPANKLKYSFTAELRDSFKTIKCSDLLNGRIDTFNVEIYVTDSTGNQDVCRTKLIIQDNQNVCPDKGNLTGNVAGLITQIDANKMAVNVPVQFYDMSNGSMIEQKPTNLEGKYAFENIEIGKPYSIKPILNNDYLNGVSTKDIVIIQKHILGKASIENPYYLIAADVNKSSSITAKDISDIRKLILGITNEFPNGNSSWNFVDSKIQISKEDAFKYASIINLVDLKGNAFDNNFIAVKTGDVTGEATTGNLSTIQSRTSHIAGLEIEAVELVEGQEYVIPVLMTQALSMNGLQLELKMDESLGQIEGIASGLLHIEDFNYSIHQNGSIVRISWNENQILDVNQGAHLFSIKVLAKSNGLLNAGSLSLSSNSIRSEVYAQNFDADLRLLYREDNNNSNESYELYQNVPNPFSGRTNIFFKLPSDQDVYIHVFDLAGKKLRSLYVEGKKGLNSIELEILGEQAGLLYYQLDAKNFIATRKMVIIR